MLVPCPHLGPFDMLRPEPWAPGTPLTSTALQEILSAGWCCLVLGDWWLVMVGAPQRCALLNANRSFVHLFGGWLGVPRDWLIGIHRLLCSLHDIRLGSLS